MPQSVILSARRPATSFATEAEMTSVAVDVAADIWWRSGDSLDFVATEIVASGAIADVVGASLDAGAVRRRIDDGITPLTDWTAIVCSSLCADSATVGEVVDYTGLSRSGASRSLSLAADHGALIRDGRHLILNEAWETPVRTVVAAELKLRDWQKGLLQAARYRGWADASWLILGATSSLRAAKAAAPSGVGLLRLTPEGQVQKGRTARWRRPTSSLERIWIGEQILSQALAAGWRPQVRAPSARFARAEHERD